LSCPRLLEQRGGALCSQRNTNRPFAVSAQGIDGWLVTYVVDVDVGKPPSIEDLTSVPEKAPFENREISLRRTQLTPVLGHFNVNT
jgi:hypothetical protein